MQSSLRRVLTTVMLLLMMLAARGHAAALRVEITSPAESAVVDVEAMVKGKVSDAKTRVYVLVRPLKTRYWWVQRLPAPPSPDGTWQTLCNFGTPSEGVGEPYEIIAIASKTRLNLIEGKTLEDVPDSGTTSAVVTVKRSK
ncbi:MAG: hypothetical protein JF614_20345 [Acidobacteria bacterium]|nr:hypothetical protein [Acidobacteriota bacterium]